MRQEFWGVVPGKSWLTVVRRSSHTEFLNAGRLLNLAIAALCGCKGRNSFQVASHHRSCHPDTFSQAFTAWQPCSIPSHTVFRASQSPFEATKRSAAPLAVRRRRCA